MGGAVEATRGAPQVCRDMAAQEGLTGLRQTVREASAGRPLQVQVQAAIDALQQAADEIETAERAADALTAWSAAPADTARLDELAESFNALEKEVQAQCEFPLS